MTTRQMKRLSQRGWTYAAIGRRAGMSRQNVCSRVNYKYVRQGPYLAEGWMAPRNWLFSHYQRNAQLRGYGWSLSLAEFTFLTQQVCCYCGCSPQTKLKGARGEFLYNGLDRKNNARGYRKGNVVSCCGICNRMKGIMTIAQFTRQVQRIAKNA